MFLQLFIHWLFSTSNLFWVEHPPWFVHCESMFLFCHFDSNYLSAIYVEKRHSFLEQVLIKWLQKPKIFGKKVKCKCWSKWNVVVIKLFVCNFSINKCYSTEMCKVLLNKPHSKICNNCISFDKCASFWILAKEHKW